MSASTSYAGKFNIGLNGKGYVISSKRGIRYYQKKRSPLFVSKFGSGDSSYRDATFWQYFVQTNWRNGAKQLKFDDAGKYWKSSDVDTTILEQLTLSKQFVSVGQIAAGVKVNCMEAWRSSQSWWNNNYGYRQQLTITNNAATTAPVGYPIKITTDTAALQTATHLRSDRKDWRIIYDNGSTLTDLTRDYVSTTATFFALQATIAAGGSVSNYYIYYGYSAESTDKQPTTEANWNAVYGMYGVTPDANTVALYHIREGSGNSLNDDSTNANTGTGNNSLIWDTDGKFGRDLNTNGQGKGFVIADSASLNLGSMTLEGWFKIAVSSPGEFIITKYAAYQFSLSSGRLQANVGNQTFNTDLQYSDGNWHHIALTYDGATTANVYVDGVSVKSTTGGSSVNSNSHKVFIGVDSGDGENANNSGINAKMQHIRISNTVRTSFPYVLSAEPTMANGAEVTTQPPASTFDLYAGGSDGKVYKWDGTSTWTMVYDTTNGSVNCMLVTSIGGTQKLLVGTGASSDITNAHAKLISFDGSTWAVNKTFNTATESQINSITEYSAANKIYVGVGPQARIYESSDMSTYTLSKDINVPQNPGYVYALKEYNRVLHAGGGSPEFLPTQYYNGFVNTYDTTQWNILYPFDFTVIKSLEFYDAYLFMGTYHGHLYVYDTSTLNPLFNFKDQYAFKVSILGMKYFDDKLYMALYPQDGTNETNVGVWIFDRRGLSLAHTISGVTGYRCFAVVNGSLFVGTGDNGMIYKLDTTYKSTGWTQLSYFDANLPSIPKLWNEVTIRHEALLSGHSISAYYRFKETDDWILLGTSNTPGDIEKSFPFQTGITSNKITLKLVLNTSDSTTTPTLTEVVMQYALYPVRKWQWNIKIKAVKNLRLLDGTFETRTAEQIRQDIEELLGSEQLYVYNDVNGETFNVLVHDIDTSSWVVNQSENDINEEEVALTLLES
jgi:hypothetical protein